MSKLAGISLIRNNNTYDYHIRETLLSLLEFCDHVYCTAVRSEDGTDEILSELADLYLGRLTILWQTEEEWQAQAGKEKLSYFTNIAIERAQKDRHEWVLYVQGDEIVGPQAYQHILSAIETYSNDEAFLMPRLNLWGDSRHHLTCPQNRMPCSTQVIRLAKSHCRAIGDAESLDGVCKWILDEAEIFHTGFIRDRFKMIGKVRNMVEGVFGMSPDKALDTMSDGWDPWVSHTRADVSEHGRKLPDSIQKWCVERDENNKARTF